MLEILKYSEDKLEVLEKPVAKSWINVVSPTDEEIIKLKSFADVPKGVLGSLKDVDQIPTLADCEDFTFIIIRTPYNNKKIDLEYTTVPIGIFVTKEIVVTICHFENDVIERLKKQRFPFRKTQFVFRLLRISAKIYLKYLKEIKEKIYKLESQLGQTQSNELVIGLLELQKDLVYFETSLKSNGILVERIAKEEMKNKYIFIKTEEDARLIDDVMDESSQALQMTSIYLAILSGTLDAFASIISNNLNKTMKILASITLVVALPTAVASIYGMNIKLPFQASQYAFMVVMLLTFLVSVVAVLVLWKKRFF